jgi:hypothetical protein
MTIKQANSLIGKRIEVWFPRYKARAEIVIQRVVRKSHTVHCVDVSNSRHSSAFSADDMRLVEVKD